MKKVWIGICAVVLIVGAGVAVHFYDLNVLKVQMESELESERTAYQTSKEKYDAAYADILSKQESWQKTVDDLKEELKQTQKEYQDTAKELQAIYDERKAEQEKKEARFNGLSEEAKKAELAIEENNKMVTYLRDNNSEYEETYISLSAYLGRDYSSLSSSEKKEYYKLSQKKKEIEDEYKKTTDSDKEE